MTGSEAAASLQTLLDSGLYYARQSQQGRNTDPLQATSTALWIRQLNALDFDSPHLGYQLANTQANFGTWSQKFSSAIADLMAYRQTFGFDGHDVKLVDSGFDVNYVGIYINSRTDDPLQNWWVNVAAPALDSIALSGVIDWVTLPVKLGAQAIGDALEGSGWVVAVLVLILVLILAIKLV